MQISINLRPVTKGNRLLDRMIDALLPQRLGKDFRWTWLGLTITNLGDGVLLAAGPLLVASVTLQPFAVAMALFVQRVPWLLFGVIVGAVIDRMDRRLLIIAVNIFRAAVLGLLGIIASGDINLSMIYVAMFLLGTAETFADNAGSTLVAVTVPKTVLGRANSRLFGGAIVANQLAGPPLGAFLFGLGIALPFGFNAICYALAAVLISKVGLTRKVGSEERIGSLRREVVEGLRWLWSHAPVRTLAIMITVFNVTFGAAFSILVLYSYERLGLSEIGFGSLMTAGAVGGLLGSVAFGWLEQRFGYALLLRVGLTIETLTHLALALTTRALVAGAVMVLFGMHAVIWGTTADTIRQRAVPDELMGRVTSVYMLGSVGALALGTLIGGAIAQRWGVTGPFWFGFVGSALLTVLIWPSLTHVAHAGDSEDRADRSTEATKGATGPLLT